MTDWIEPDINNLLPGDPWTSAKALYTAQNPIALAEQSVGAPKIANKIAGGAGTTVFSGLSTFGGLIIWGNLSGDGSAPSNATLTMEASTNGSTYGALSTIAEIANNTQTSFQLFVDFSTGLWQSVYNNNDSVIISGEYDTGTLANTVGMTHFRLTVSLNGAASYLVMPQGGQSAS